MGFLDILNEYPRPPVGESQCPRPRRPALPGRRGRGHSDSICWGAGPGPILSLCTVRRDHTSYLVDPTIHLVDLAIHLVDLTIHLVDLAIHLVDLAIHLVDLTIHLVDLSIHLADATILAASWGAGPGAGPAIHLVELSGPHYPLSGPHYPLSGPHYPLSEPHYPTAATVAKPICNNLVLNVRVPGIPPLDCWTSGKGHCLRRRRIIRIRT